MASYVPPAPGNSPSQPANGVQQPVVPPGMVPAAGVYAQPGAAPQVVYYPQTAAVVPPAAVPPTTLQPVAPHAETHKPTESQLEHEAHEVPALNIYTHSQLFYWWPVWVVGYIMALLTWTEGTTGNVAGEVVKFYPNSSLGVIFFLTLFLVILFTSISVRGAASGMVILGTFLTIVLLAYFNLWDRVLGWFGGLRIHLDLGAYFWFATLMFVVWLFTVFVFDRMSYWVIKPGQITYERMIGAGSRSYDTNGMMLEKYQGDLFRNWVLGLGSGDMHILTTGATRDRLDLPNVLFVGSKIAAIQRMIAERPNEFGNASLK